MSRDDREDREAAEASREPAESAWQRRRRLAEAFGDVLPEQTRDERDEAARSREGKGDDWYRDQVPPHHG